MIVSTRIARIMVVLHLCYCLEKERKLHHGRLICQLGHDVLGLHLVAVNPRPSQDVKELLACAQPTRGHLLELPYQIQALVQDVVLESTQGL